MSCGSDLPCGGYFCNGGVGRGVCESPAACGGSADGYGCAFVHGIGGGGGGDLVPLDQEECGGNVLSVDKVPAHKGDLVAQNTDIVSVRAVHVFAGHNISAVPEITDRSGAEGGRHSRITGIKDLFGVQLPVAVPAEEHDLRIFFQDRFQRAFVIYAVPVLPGEGACDGVVDCLMQEHEHGGIGIGSGEGLHAFVKPVELCGRKGCIKPVSVRFSAQIDEMISAHSFVIIDGGWLRIECAVQFFGIFLEQRIGIAAVPVVIADGDMQGGRAACGRMETLELLILCFLT